MKMRAAAVCFGFAVCFRSTGGLDRSAVARPARVDAQLQPVSDRPHRIAQRIASGGAAAISGSEYYSLSSS